MSRIYFHSEHGEADVRGTERALMGGVCHNLLMSFLGPSKYDREPLLLRLVPEGHYLHKTKPDQFPESLSNYLQFTGDLVIDGRQVSGFSLALNTTFAVGNDPLKLYARLHGQCELHCWVDGPNRKWLAGIIEKGLSIGLYRPDSGWESVVALLISRNDCPVVCSYSVCDQFPNSSIDGTEYETDEDRDKWYDLPTDVQWSRAMEAHRKNTGRLEMKPDDWDEFYAGSGLTAFDAIKAAIAARPATTARTPFSPDPRGVGEDSHTP